MQRYKTELPWPNQRKVDFCVDCVLGKALETEQVTLSSKNFGLLPMNSLKFLVPSHYKWSDVVTKLPTKISFSLMFLTEGEMHCSFMSQNPKNKTLDCLSWTISTNQNPDHCFH